MTGKIREGVAETVQWFQSLDASFAFLLVLPILVGFAGLVAECLKRRRAL